MVSDVAMRKKDPFEPPAPHGGERGAAPGQPTTGRILRIVHAKGHGIIRAEDGRELLFRRSSVTAGWFSDLREGDVVQCEAIADRHGPRAVKVRKR